MCPCKRATGPPTLQSRHLPRCRGGWFHRQKTSHDPWCRFSFPSRFFFSRYSLSLSPLHSLSRFTRVFLSLSLFFSPVRHVVSAHFRRFVGHRGPRANYKNTETNGELERRAVERRYAGSLEDKAGRSLIRELIERRGTCRPLTSKLLTTTIAPLPSTDRPTCPLPSLPPSRESARNGRQISTDF